ncbi:lipopolysaccharide transport system ATP-binding protein [Candidatus Fervidibacteria bacterium JGI MDM2 JNZ-1-D12]
MSDIAIRVEKLSKRYRIGQRERYYALRDVLARSLTAPFRWFSRDRRLSVNDSQSPNYIWALKEVSFEVKRGEVVGIIGRNGAGKTTLLKILARITEPTEGYAEVYGRVGSLLEVGTGFHPELTGRENIYFSGAILGMKKREIDKKFDEIVAFAEIEKFIDTPVKYYSTGMYVRLAFAVAAHLDPEILLVDEVLAVGDIQFQKKCLGKMGDVAKGGRTVLFVSHQMNQIRRLCERVIWLDSGRIRQAGPAHEVTSAYEAALTSGEGAREQLPDAPKVKARFLRWEIVEPQNSQPNILTSFGPVSIQFTLQVNEPIRFGVHGIALFSTDGQLMWGTAAYNLNLPQGQHFFHYKIPFLPLRPGAYYWRVSLYDEQGLVDVWDCVPEMIVATQPVTHPHDEWAGLLNIPYHFEVLESHERGV